MIPTVEIPEYVIERFEQNNKTLERLLSTLNGAEFYMTLQEAATYIRRSTAYVRRRKHLIGFHKEGKDLTFKRTDLDAYMDTIYVGSSERNIEQNKEGGTQKRAAAF